jgi:preprotein translocase subunit SecB
MLRTLHLLPGLAVLSILSVNPDNIKEAVIGLGIEFGDINTKEVPIYVKVRIIGVFVIEVLDQDITDEQIVSFYKVNGVTILFPYLRSLVSDLTSKGSEPPIILPTINVAEMVKDIKGNFD